MRNDQGRRGHEKTPGEIRGLQWSHGESKNDNAVRGTLDAIEAKFQIPIIYASQNRDLATERAANGLSKHFTYWWLWKNGYGRVLIDSDRPQWPGWVRRDSGRIPKFRPIVIVVYLSPVGRRGVRTAGQAGLCCLTQRRGLTESLSLLRRQRDG